VFYFIDRASVWNPARSVAQKKGRYERRNRTEGHGEVYAGGRKMETDTNLETTLYALRADCRKSSDGSRWDMQQLVSTDDLDFDEV